MTDSEIRKDEVVGVLRHFHFFRGHLDDYSVVPRRLLNQNARFRIGDREWVIKRYTATKAPPNLWLSHQVQKALAEYDVPVAKLEPAQSGETLVRHGKFLYSVHRWVHGLHFNPLESNEPVSTRLIGEIGTALGRLHLVTSQHFERRDEPERLRAQALLTSAAKSADELWMRNRLGVSDYRRMMWRARKPSLDRWVVNALPRFRQLAGWLSERSEAGLPSSLSEVIIGHNDLNWLNLVFDETNTLRAILDFDNIQFIPRQVDIGFAALGLVGANNDHLAVLLECYEESSGLTTNLDAVRLSMVLRCVRSFFWSVRMYCRGQVRDLELLTVWLNYLDGCLERFSADPEYRILLSE